MADIPINPVTRRVEFTGNTGTGPFAFTFNVLAQADIAAYKNNTLLALTSDYTVSLNSNGTGSITLTSALIATDELVIIGDLPLSRTTDFVTAGDLLASSLNQQFDSNVVMSQQLDERFDRTIRSQPGDINKNLYLPLVSSRASQLLSFDSSGNITTTNLSNVPDIGTVNLTVSGLASFADGSLGAPSITNIGDTNTGIYFPAADQLAFTAGGNDIFSITSTYGLMSKPLYFSDGILLTDNSATALTIKEGSNNYLTFITTNGSEKLSFGKPIDVTGAITTNTSLNIASSTTVDGILDEDNMASNSATKLATQQSIKAYVDAQVGTVDTLAEVLANGNTTGSNNIIVTAGQSITVDTISETTAANGVVIDGVTLKDGGATVTADVSFGDNVKAIFGAGSDLQIYHSGTGSFITEGGTGDLYIQASNLILEDPDGNNYFAGVDGGATLMYYNGASKLATTSTGIDVTGSGVFSNSTDVTQSFAEFGRTPFSTHGSLLVSGTGTGHITTNTNASGNSTVSVGATRIAVGNGELDFYKSGSTTAGAARTFSRTMGIATNGDISFYEDTGTTPKLFWDASAESLGINVTDPIYPLEVQGEVGIEIYNGTGGGDVLNFRPSLGDANKYNMSISSYDHSGGGVGPADGLSINGYDGVSITTGSSTVRQERMRIDSSGNVGIGVTPARQVHMHNASGDNNFHITNSTTGSTATDGFSIVSQSTTNDVLFNQRETANMRFFTANDEKMRISSAGSLLVGKSVTTFNTTGMQIDGPNGNFSITASGATTAFFNRTSTDGNIAEFYKDGATVGSIGSRSSAIYIGRGDTGISFTDNDDAVYPVSPSGLVTRDAAIDLGISTTRFKDLYLSGGVYLGGTGAANKLEDYEEGTWAPVIRGNSSAGSATYATQTGTYTKVGRTVTFEFAVVWSGHTGTGVIEIGGFPFNAGTQTYYLVQTENISLTSGSISFTSRIDASDNYGLLIQTPTGGGVRAAVTMDAAGDIRGVGTYQTA